MQSTSVAVGGKGTNPKTSLYVGGLEESVTEATLHSTFIPFGEIKDVSVPLDNTTGARPPPHPLPRRRLGGWSCTFPCGGRGRQAMWRL